MADGVIQSDLYYYFDTARVFSLLDNTQLTTSMLSLSGLQITATLKLFDRCSQAIRESPLLLTKNLRLF